MERSGRTTTLVILHWQNAQSLWTGIGVDSSLSLTLSLSLSLSISLYLSLSLSLSLLSLVMFLNVAHVSRYMRVMSLGTARHGNVHVAVTKAKRCIHGVGL
jgi:hypothetical protein